MSRFLTRFVTSLCRRAEGYTPDGSLVTRLAGKVTCLLYHRIADKHEQSWLEAGGVPSTSPEAFENHLQVLRRLGAKFFTLQDLADGQFPASNEVGISITFDDGFADNFSRAMPLLDKYHAKGVFFVTTNVIEASSPLWDHELCWFMQFHGARDYAAKAFRNLTGKCCSSDDVAWRIRHIATQSEALEVIQTLRQNFASLPKADAAKLYCSWTDLRNAMSLGHEIASHTVSHPMRYGLDQTTFLQELMESKKFLEAGLGDRVVSISFPFNGHLFADFELCSNAGYKTASTVEPGRITKKTSLLEVPRRTVFRPHDSVRHFRSLLAEERWK